MGDAEEVHGVRQLGDAATGQGSDEIVERVDGVAWHATIERQIGHSEHGERVRHRTGEQIRGLVVTSLAAAQFSQPCVGLGHSRRSGLGQGDSGLLELLFGMRPVAVEHQESAVVRTADPDGEVGTELRRHRLHLLAPLRRSVEVAHPLAGVDHVAEGPRGGDAFGDLARRGCQARLVEASHPCLHGAFGHEGQTLEGQADEHQIRQ